MPWCREPSKPCAACPARPSALHTARACPRLGDAASRTKSRPRCASFAAPAKLPAPITARLHAEINRALASPALQTRLTNEAIDPMPMTPEQFGNFIQAGIARWSALARERKISLDD